MAESISRRLEIGEASEAMTDSQFAALMFEPWVHGPDKWVPPSSEEWRDCENPHLVTVRIAWVLLHRSKEELIEHVRKLERLEELQSLLDKLSGSASFFEDLAKVLKFAEARLLCAASAEVFDLSL